MTKREENRYSMYRAVEQVLSDNQSVVDSLPALADSVTEFKTAMHEISDQDNVYKNITGGATDAKNTAEEALIDTMISLNGVLYSITNNIFVFFVKKFKSYSISHHSPIKKSVFFRVIRGLFFLLISAASPR